MGGPGTSGGRAHRNTGLVCAAVVLAVFAACGGDKKKQPHAKPAAGPDAGTATAKPLYSDTTAGLERQIRGVLDAVKGGNATADSLIAAFALPNHEAWFKRVFGEAKGATLAKDYAPLAADITQMRRLFRKLIADEQTQLLVERFAAPDAPGAIGYQSHALRTMTERVPLYSVRLKKAGASSGFHLWSFVYEKSSFRWIGHVRGLGLKPTKGDLDRNLLRRRDADQLAN